MLDDVRWFANAHWVALGRPHHSPGGTPILYRKGLLEGWKGELKLYVVSDVSRLSKIYIGEELDPLELIELVPESLERAKNLLERAVGKGTRPYECDEICMALGYKLAVLIAAVLKDKWLQNKLANLVALETEKALDSEDLYVTVSLLRKLGYDVELLDKPLQVPVRLHRGTVLSEAYPARIHSISYVKLANRFLSDPSWKLVNKALLNGYVYMKSEELIRLAREGVYAKVLNDVKEVSAIELDELPPKLRELVEEVSSSLRESLARRKRIEEKVKGLYPEALPPCIKAIYARALEGANLSHQERFTLATFLLNVGMDVDEVLNVFSRAPDFNEKIARYQIEHLAGLRGSRKKYSPPSCKTLVSWNLCPSRSECKANHPLSEYRRRLRAIRRNAQGSDSDDGGLPGMDGSARRRQRMENSEDSINNRENS